MSETDRGVRILVVEDEEPLAKLVVSYLERERFEVEATGDGADALVLARRWDPDVVVLDLGLPGMDGVEVCRQVRTFSDCYIIMLTARAEEVDKLVGLSVGADDYLTKPFSPRELVLRVGSVLRRAGESSDVDEQVLEDGGLRIDGPSRQATLDGVALALTMREFDLLRFLVGHPGVAFTRVELLERVWGWSFGDQSTVTVHVRRLREKVEKDPTSPARLQTVWGVGYRWERSA